jgi:internalin A
MGASLNEFEIIKKLEVTLDIVLKPVLSRYTGSAMCYVLEKNHITHLNLSGLPNVLDLAYEDILKLKNLKSLELRACHIENINLISEMMCLRELDLSNNAIKNISPLSSLVNIKSLKLSENKISSLIGLENLIKLDFLEIFENSVQDLDPLRNLISLSCLNLSANKIRNLEPIQNLKKLKILWLYQNNLTDCQIIENFKYLTELNIAANNLKNISFLSSLSNLRALHLHDNNVTNVAPLTNLTNLTFLDVENNSIESIEPLKNLQKLASLILRNNPIKSLPNWIVSFKNMDIIWEDGEITDESIYLFNNPIENVPIEIIKNGKVAIRRHFARINDQGVDFIYEVKLTLVGDGNAGKTSLQKRIISESAKLPQKDSRTRGIEIKDWNFKKEKNKAHIAHIWDFGGQDVYYPVHRFFITENSVFLLLASTRQANHNFDYWIPTIFQFGGKSPIILGQTCHDGNKMPWHDLGTYVSSANFNIIKTQDSPYYELNLVKNNEGLAKLKSVIIDQIINLPHYGKSVPKSWVVVRESLKEHAILSPCISFERFKQICKESSPSRFSIDADIIDCCQFLYDIGVVLWYSQSEILSEWVILQPEWAMNAVYRLIDDAEVQSQKGTILETDFARLWNESFQSKHKILKQMLKMFKIAFPKKHKNQDFLIPARLPSMPSEKRWIETGTYLRLEYKYQFMPKGLVNQLSAELSRYISSDEEVWNNAVNFSNDLAESQVEEDFYNRKLCIKARGRDPRSLTILIMEALKNITEEYKGVKADIFVPCTCDTCKQSSKITAFVYEDLIRWSSKSKDSVYCNESQTFLNIDDLLYNVGLPNSSKTKKLSNEDNGKMITKTITIFLASSSELKDERDQFEIFINRENKKLINRGIFLKLERWEDFTDKISRTRLQDEYNRVLSKADLFVGLFFTKVGKFTAEEFEIAYSHFKAFGKPYIYTYFKDSEIEIGKLNRDFVSRLDFEEKLKSLEHFQTKYTSIEGLTSHFKNQLDKILDDLINGQFL